MWTLDSANVAKIAQKGDGLQSFAQAHLVRENARDAILVERNKPIQTGDLVVSHLATLDERWRISEEIYVLIT